MIEKRESLLSVSELSNKKPSSCPRINLSYAATGVSAQDSKDKQVDWADMVSPAGVVFVGPVNVFIKITR
jgi:hypothetical protein